MTLIDCLKYPGTRLTEAGCSKYATAHPERCSGCERAPKIDLEVGKCSKCKRPRKLIAGKCKSCYNAKYMPTQNERQKKVRAAAKVGASQIVINITVSPSDAVELLQFIGKLKHGGAA